jgi:lyso-ornithine lipid O-acyltransferase
MLNRVRLALTLASAVLAALLLLPAQKLLVVTSSQHRDKIPILYARFLCRMLGLRVVSSRPVPRAAILTVSNHVSWTDIIVLTSAGYTCFLAKSEIARWPVVGRLARLQGIVFIDRGRKRSILDANEKIGSVLGQHRPVVFFPEGTTNDGTILKKVLSSHFEAARRALLKCPDLNEIPVEVIALRYSCTQNIAMGRKERARIAWYGDTELLPHLKDFFQLTPVQCEIRPSGWLTFQRTTNRKQIAVLASEYLKKSIEVGAG